jgi:predicted secreted protein
MSWISGTAIFFIIWWVVLFVALPFGLRTQDEDGDVTLGTTPSAPRGPHMARALLLTTVIAAVIFGGLYVAVEVYGIGLDDLPQIAPSHGSG